MAQSIAEVIYPLGEQRLIQAMDIWRASHRSRIDVEIGASVGFVVVNEDGCLLGRLVKKESGYTPVLVDKLEVSLPRKRDFVGTAREASFARLRITKRHEYLERIVDLCNRTFVGPEGAATVTHLEVCGSPQFALKLNDLLDLASVLASVRSEGVQRGQA